jgi:MinD-like ATPase involved in chromosome partitioning or flagellar assembly
MSDLGSPVVLANPESSAAKAFESIVGKLAAQISIANFSSQPLEIIEE